MVLFLMLVFMNMIIMQNLVLLIYLEFLLNGNQKNFEQQLAYKDGDKTIAVINYITPNND